MNIKCAKCSTFGNSVYHASVAEVRECQMGNAQRVSHEQRQPQNPGPRPPAQRQATAFPAGRYAVEVDGVLRFFKVDKPTEGRWKGHTFVKEQAGDDLYDVRGNRKLTAIAAIARDPEGAMLTYGKELGHCGHCGRTLTNEESRAAGIGPICRAKVAF